MILRFPIACLLLLSSSILNAQSDVVIGTDYALNLQLKDNNADAWISHNAKASTTGVLNWITTHATFGSRGMFFRYYTGIHFYADAVATTAGSTFTPTTRFFIGNNGNIGIGTTSPLSLLHVYSLNNSVISIGNSTNGYTHMNMGTNADANGYGFIQSVKSEGSTWGDLILNKSGGNVGIGTTTPDAKLTVKGTVHAQEVKVDLSIPGPDYVFETGYQMPTLEELNTYIKLNKHLPEIPSAEFMKENGIELGEMNMLLLKKIEELTLYMIELKKENEEIKRQLQSNR